MTRRILGNLKRTLLSLRKPRTLRQALRRTQGMTSFAGCELLYQFAKEATGPIVEIGSYRGRSTVALGWGSMDGHGVPVYAIDPHAEFTGERGGVFGPEDRAAFYRAMLATDAYKVVRLVNLPSQMVGTYFTDRTVSVLFIDGDHSDEAVKHDWSQWSYYLSPDGTVIFDDTDWPGPAKLVAELQQQGWRVVGECFPIKALRKEP